ncbi:MAG TPA: high-potential iron-sulfur protein [Povalibacter sp.]|uniref:high-potential iron-sulfur protein n=1 Tax=Povalibacter sp. TaxID=1962978 RepID=UPI002CA91D74|nr:high-potential iron-sulfur protein [Povalibacter sp.]HMN47150.1 high-potential iron-sulfur protein [Povalibacter sp.]
MSAIRRRCFLFMGLQVPVALAVKAAYGACVDPDELPDSEHEMRESLDYIDAGADAAEVCGGCSFFKADAGSSCGHCEVLRGQVNAKGHCVSWTRRA